MTGAVLDPAGHGGNVQGVPAPNARPRWISQVLPGSVHDLTTAREQVLGTLCDPAAGEQDEAAVA